MKQPAILSLLLTILSFLPARQLQAQPDFPPTQDSVRLLTDINGYNLSGGAGKLDSAVLFALDLETQTAKDYGEISHSHAVAIANYLGYLYLVKDDFLSAFNCLQKSLGIFTRLGDTTCSRYADAVYFTGLVAAQLQLNDLSEKYLTMALPLQKDHSPNYYYAQGLLMLGAGAANRGDYEKAASIYLLLNDTLEHHRKDAYMNYLRSSLYNNMAIIYQQTGNPQKSLLYIQKSLATSKLADDEGYHNTQFLQLLLNQAEGWLECGQQDSALRSCRQAEDSLRLPKNNNAYYYALTLMQKANIYQQQNRLSEAIALVKHYVRIMDSLTMGGSDYDLNLVSLGILYTDTRQYDKADSLFRQVIGQLRRQGLLFSYPLQQAIAGLCSNLIDQKKYDEAADSLVGLIHLTLQAMKQNFSGLAENDQLKYTAGLTDVFDLLYTCLYNKPAPDKEILKETGLLEWQRQNLTLNNQIHFRERIRNAKDTALEHSYNDWLTNRQLLSGQYSLPYDQRTFNVDSLEELCGNLEEKLAAKNLSEPLTRRLIPPSPGSADIGFVRFRYRSSGNKPDSAFYAAFIYKAETTPVFVHLCSEKALLRLLKDKTGHWIDEDQVTQKIYYEGSPSSASLYRLVWAPLEPYIDGITTIHYSTAGLFNNIAFHAVYDGKNYLSRRYTLHRYLSLLDAGLSTTSHERPQTVSLWGNMNYDAIVNTGNTRASPASLLPGRLTTPVTKGLSGGPLPALGSTEITGLKAIFTAGNCSFTSFEGATATEENFKAQAPMIKGILHISTHGFYTPFQKEKERSHIPGNFLSGIVDPLFRCGLAFSGANFYWLNGRSRKGCENGLLTGYEVAQLDLHQVELVTLSACETGLGDVTDNEGNLGLQIAFRLAGAGNLLVSLWQVPARQTAELLSLFYRNWLKGSSFSMALLDAQHSLQEKNYPPYYWAGFVLIE